MCERYVDIGREREREREGGINEFLRCLNSRKISPPVMMITFLMKILFQSELFTYLPIKMLKIKNNRIFDTSDFYQDYQDLLITKNIPRRIDHNYLEFTNID